MPLYDPTPITNVVIRASGGSQTWTDMPAALTEINASVSLRTLYDLSLFSQARLVVRVNTLGAAGAEFRMQYSTDESAWDYLDGSAGPAVAIGGGSTGTRAGTWVNIASAAKAEVYLRLVGINGDGAADPVTGNLFLHLR